MSSMLEDADGNPIGYIAWDLVSLETSAPVIVYADPDTEGSRLRSGTSDAFRLKARLSGSGEAYQFIDGEGIEISGTLPVPFDLICVASEVIGLVRDAVFVGIGHSGPAGWDD